MVGILFPLIWVILRLITGKQRIKLIQRLRNDSTGSGYFGASRGNRLHNGVDIESTEGEVIYAPFMMYVERYSKASSGSKTSGLRFIPRDISDGTHGYMWYLQPYDDVIGEWVGEGEPLGVAQNMVGLDYPHLKGKMQNHIHIEQWAGSAPINIETSYV